ncbi:MAG: hypothetical protein QXG78_01505 [Candidatus Methanomethyliaceae archaeon]
MPQEILDKIVKKIKDNNYLSCDPRIKEVINEVLEEKITDILNEDESIKLNHSALKKEKDYVNKFYNQDYVTTLLTCDGFGCLNFDRFFIFDDFYVDFSDYEYGDPDFEDALESMNDTERMLYTLAFNKYRDLFKMIFQSFKIEDEKGNLVNNLKIDKVISNTISLPEWLLSLDDALLKKGYKFQDCSE